MSAKMLHMQTVEMRSVDVEAILDLRHRILRADKPFEAAHFDCDDAAQHFAAIEADKVVACLSFVENPLGDDAGWQLRGMACDASCQGKGIGKQLLSYAENIIANDAENILLWCNAREKAVGFYQRCGWEIISDIFDIEHVGPHFKMSKRVS